MAMNYRNSTKHHTHVNQFDTINWLLHWFSLIFCCCFLFWFWNLNTRAPHSLMTNNTHTSQLVTTSLQPACTNNNNRKMNSETPHFPLKNDTESVLTFSSVQNYPHKKLNVVFYCMCYTMKFTVTQKKWMFTFHVFIESFRFAVASSSQPNRIRMRSINMIEHQKIV